MTEVHQCYRHADHDPHDVRFQGRREIAFHCPGNGPFMEDQQQREGQMKTKNVERILKSIKALDGMILQMLAMFPEYVKSEIDRPRLGLATTRELLTEIKGGMKHGQWLPWVEENLPFAEDTAQRYMRVFTRRDQIPHGAVFQLTDAYKLLSSGGSDVNARHNAPPLKPVSVPGFPIGSPARH